MTEWQLCSPVVRQQQRQAAHKGAAMTTTNQ